MGRAQIGPPKASAAAHTACAIGGLRSPLPALPLPLPLPATRCSCLGDSMVGRQHDLLPAVGEVQSATVVVVRIRGAVMGMSGSAAAVPAESAVLWRTALMSHSGPAVTVTTVLTAACRAAAVACCTGLLPCCTSQL